LGSASSSGWITNAGMPFRGAGRLDRLRSDGSIVVAGTTVTACWRTWSVGSAWPMAVRPVACEEPESCAEPPTHRPLAVVVDCCRSTRTVPDGTGTSERSADVISTVPTSGTSMLVGATSSGTSAGVPMRRPETSLVALATCSLGMPAGPSSDVRADTAVAASGAGKSGRWPPALAPLHVLAPAFAASWGTAGWPTSAAAEQFQPSTPAGAATAGAPVTPSATSRMRTGLDTMVTVHIDGSPETVTQLCDRWTSVRAGKECLERRKPVVTGLSRSG
jgi:hypothetical protein